MPTYTVTVANLALTAEQESATQPEKDLGADRRGRVRLKVAHLTVPEHTARLEWSSRDELPLVRA
jgi:hypothetical protein